jgi:GGDEF domain-containing protein
MIIIEDTAGKHDVAVLVEEILTAMAAPIRVGDHELTVTMSIGVVEWPVADTNPRELLQAAGIPGAAQKQTAKIATQCSTG